VLLAAKEKTFSPFVPWYPEMCISAHESEGKKPHQGVATKKSAHFLGHEVCNSTTALGLRGQAALDRIGSRCTGKERDNETGLDYFGARYYSNGLGRFITPDWSATPVPVPYADLSDPQTLNQYSYVRNIPTVKVDPDGHQECPTCPTTIAPPEPAPGQVEEALESVRRGTQAAEEAEAAAAGEAAGSRLLGPIVGVAIFVGEMIFPESVESGDKPAPGFVPRELGQINQQEQNQAPVIEDARKSTRTIRREWENAKGKKWPKEKDGQNYHADHRRPLADGGSNNAARNIQPRTHRDHVNRHKKRGDFKRWAKRRNKKP
jgi:RHS repeat-associated protein